MVQTARVASTKMKERDIGGNRLKEPSEAWLLYDKMINRCLYVLDREFVYCHRLELIFKLDTLILSDALVLFIYFGLISI